MWLILIDRKGHVGLLCCPEDLILLYNCISFFCTCVIETSGNECGSPLWKYIHFIKFKSLGVQLTNQSTTKLLLHSFPTWLLLPGLKINDMKIPTVSVFNQIPLAVCVCQRMCLKTHKPQTKQRLLKTRAVPELITNITLFGPTKPSFFPSWTLFLCTCVQVTSLAQCWETAAVVLLPQTGWHCYSLWKGQKVFLACLCCVLFYSF